MAMMPSASSGGSSLGHNDPLLDDDLIEPDEGTANGTLPIAHANEENCKATQMTLFTSPQIERL